MATCTEDINLFRLLTYCENQLKSDCFTFSPASEKRKLATYVQYLSSLQNQSAGKEYEQRIAQCTQAVQAYCRSTTDQGAEEAKRLKSQHLTELKQLENPEPEWLKKLKETPKKKEIQKNEVRQRKPKEEGLNTEQVLQHHREMHSELSQDLGRMAEQLKQNSLTFGERLDWDDRLLKEAQKAVETNLTQMATERKRLDTHYSASWKTSFMSLGVVLFVCILFVLVFFTIKFLPKAS